MELFADERKKRVPKRLFDLFDRIADVLDDACFDTGESVPLDDEDSPLLIFRAAWDASGTREKLSTLLRRVEATVPVRTVKGSSRYDIYLRGGSARKIDFG